MGNSEELDDKTSGENLRKKTTSSVLVASCCDTASPKFVAMKGEEN